MVPLVSVLYAIALSSFAIAAYYGFRLSRLTRKAKVMVMITKDGPASLVCGLILLAASQVPSLITSLMQVQLVFDFFLVPSAVLLVGSALMFALGFQKMYAIYRNEKLKMSVNTVLDELLEKETSLQEDYR
ncbi:MAG: hypothetical protein ACRECH_18075 [Nitrososphaerales archaeon]